MSAAGSDPVPVAFVLGGGGVHGAAEVGMLQALHERGIEPDLVVGTSVGALNGAVLADAPGTAVERLTDLWVNIDESSPFDASLLERASTFARTRTHLHSNHRLRRMLLTHLDARRFEELALPFQCVAASIERAGARWFVEGPLIPALLATTAIPGLLPPVEIDGEHHLDGGLVDSIPVSRAITLGAQRVYVLQVGRVEQPLTAPTRPWEVGLIAFEIARRHRFVEAMNQVPDDVDVQVLPSGVELHHTDTSQYRYRDTSNIPERIAAAYEATIEHLDGLEREASDAAEKPDAAERSDLARSAGTQRGVGDAEGDDRAPRGDRAGDHGGGGGCEPGGRGAGDRGGGIGGRESDRVVSDRGRRDR